MKCCQPHWDALRAAVQDRGLYGWVGGARANAATPGPWCTESYSTASVVTDWRDPADPDDDGSGWQIAEVLQSGPHAEPDAAFIAAARDDIPALLAEIDRLRAREAEIAPLVEAVREAREAERAADAAYDVAEDAYHVARRSDNASRSALDLAADAHLSAAERLDRAHEALADTLLAREPK